MDDLNRELVRDFASVWGDEPSLRDLEALLCSAERCGVDRPLAGVGEMLWGAPDFDQIIWNVLIDFIECYGSLLDLPDLELIKARFRRTERRAFVGITYNLKPEEARTLSSREMGWSA